VEIDHPVNGPQSVLEQFTFKLVAVKTVAWSLDPTTKDLRIQLTMEYGGLLVTVPSQKAGDKPATEGWDRVKNISIMQ
jgi:hypothetical protein